MNRSLFACIALLILVSPAWGEVLDGYVEKTFPARDSLEVGNETTDDARECLAGLVWPPVEFEVRCTPASKGCGDAFVRFPSPRPSGDEQVDNVLAEWYAARDPDGRLARAPAVVIVHEIDRRMTIGRLFARQLQQRGVHAFMIQLPRYGERRSPQSPALYSNLFETIRQGIVDVRRARDAVAALPCVETGNISLQGTSLGGFVASTAAGLDQGYSGVFLMLSGGNLYDVLENGNRDAAKVREGLARAGLVGEQLRELTWRIEPLRLAHRLDPSRTWLYSGKLDTVVPLKDARSLAQAAGLPETHHICLLADHYTGVFFLPFMVEHIATQVRSAGVESTALENSETLFR